MDGREFTRGKGRNHRKLSDADRLEIVRLYTTPLPDGTWMGVTTIAPLFGVTHACIQYQLKRAGVRLRTPKEAHAGGKRCKPIVNLPVGAAPACRCGCGQPTGWNRHKNRWDRYVGGHYRPPQPYWDPDWLREQYVDRRRTTQEIADDFGIAASTVAAQMRRHGIPLRDRSASRLGRKVAEKNHAWKGGVADWDYASGWKAIARKIRDRDGWTCQRCGERRARWGRALHVHHINGNKMANDPTNLVSLCADCHALVHAETKGGGA